jgi:hypothetical protein
VPRGLTRRQLDQAFLDAEPPDWFVEMRKWPYRGEAWRHWLEAKRAGPQQVPLPDG